MAKAANLNIRLGLDSRGLNRGLKNAETKLQQSVRKFGDFGRQMSISVSAPLIGIGTAAVNAFVRFDKLEKALTAVSGSAGAAQIEFAKLRESAKLPGLGLEEAVQGSIRLQAVGLTADEARKSLETFGTAIAAAGGGAENLERVVYQLTQMISKNRILQEDFGIIQENIPLIGGALEKAFGTRNIEAIRASSVSATEFNERLVDALATLPELQGELGGLGNDFENLKNEVNAALVSLGRTVSESLNLREVVQGLSGFVTRLVDGFNSLNPIVQKTIIQVAAVAAAIGPTIVAIRGLAVAFTFLTGPVGIITVAIGALVSGLIYAYNTSAQFRGFVTGLITVFKELGGIIYNVAEGITESFLLLKQGDFRLAGRRIKEALTEDLEGFDVGQAWADGFQRGVTSEIKTPKIIQDIVAGNLPQTTTAAGQINRGQTSPETGATGEARPLIEIPSLEPLQLFREELESLNEVQLKAVEIGNAVSESYGGVAKLLNAASLAVTNAATSGEASFKKLGQAALKAAADVARAALIEVVTTALADSFKKLGLLAIPLAAGIAGLAGGVFNSILKGLKIPALASGGLAFSPTLAVVGDNRGAGSDPEVIAPLSKLKQYLGGNNQVVGTFRVAGRDLELVLERSQADSQRVSPF